MLKTSSLQNRIADQAEAIPPTAIVKQQSVQRQIDVENKIAEQRYTRFRAFQVLYVTLIGAYASTPAVRDFLQLGSLQYIPVVLFALVAIYGCAVAGIGVQKAYATAAQHANFWEQQPEARHFSVALGRFGDKLHVRMIAVQLEPVVFAACWLLLAGWCVYLTVKG